MESFFQYSNHGGKLSHPTRFLERADIYTKKIRKAVMSLKLETESQPLKKACVGGHNKHTTNLFPPQEIVSSILQKKS